MHDIFFFTDIHGMYDLYRAIMNYCTEQDPECIIIFGGDACDRGKDGYKIMKELLANPQVIYLRGNHEDLFVSAALEIKQHFNFTGASRSEIMERLGIAMYHYDEFPYLTNCIYNGGMKTLTDWILDGASLDILDDLNNLQYTASYGNIDMCHAGGHYNVFNRVQLTEYSGKSITVEDKTSILWDRNMINYGWAPNRTCIFGHTPVYHLSNKLKTLDDTKPCSYYGNLDDRFTGRKIDMDTAACGTGIAYVLNLHTMIAHGFMDTEYMNDEIRKHDVKKIDCIQL